MCDLGLSRVLANGAALTNSGHPNSPAWQSPEVLRGEAYGKASDVFSFGVVLWEILTLQQPWNQEDEQGRAPSQFTIISAVSRGQRLPLPDPCDIDGDLGRAGAFLPEGRELVELVASCWDDSPVARPTMAEVAMQLRDIINRVRERLRTVCVAAVPGGAAAGGGRAA